MNETAETYEHSTLKAMFPELEEAKVIKENSSPSYNDGGNNVITIWQKDDKFYRTRYNDWSVKHPDTTCKRVTKMVIIKEKWIDYD